MDKKIEKIRVPKLKPRNPEAKSLEGFPPVTLKDRRQLRGGAKNTTRYFEDDDYLDEK